jgi:hypothetical protein
MNDETRVLARKGARELTGKEIEEVNGGIHTETKCSSFNGQIDGDPGECGAVW